MHNNSVVSKAVRFALIAGATTAAWTAPVAVAAEGDEVERIEVTGSRITRTDLETASPITTITAEDINVQGIQDVGQFLQQSAVMSGSPAMTTTNNGGNGGTFIELRGLGSSRTLVLVNGRRPVSSDFQTIPASMIERIDILKDGASATYGADAVAGVVNIITRKDFEGVEINAQYKGAFDVSEYQETSLSIVAGKAFESGNIVVGVDYVDMEPVYQGDVDKVDFFQYPWQVWGTAAEESFWKNGLIGTGDNANVIEVGSGSTPCGNYYLADGSQWTNDTCDGGIADIGDMRPFVGGGPNNDTYNYAPVNYIQTPYQKLNVFVEGRFDLNDTTSMYTETRINKRESRQELAAVPYDTRFDPGYSGLLPDGTPFNGISADNYYNPFGEDIVRSRRRMLEGGRSFEQDVLRFQQVLGITGEISESWTYDLSYNYGYSQITENDFGQLYGPNLAKAMGPSFMDDAGNVVCGTPDAPIADCVSLNLFGGAGSVTKEMLDYITAPLVDSSNYTLQQITGYVSGDLFELPAGVVGSSFGIEYRKEEAEAQVDSGKFMGEVTGNKSKGTNGEYDVTSYFAEFRVPLLADLPFAERVEVPVGLRYDDYSTFGGEFTYQAGLEWNAGYGLLLRSTYGTVFRAPGIGSLYGPGVDSFPSATDPCRASNWAALTAEQQGFCMADGVPTGGTNNNDSQQLASAGGNPDLQPEEGDTFTIGVAYSPEFAEGLDFTVDYWAVEIDGVISSIDAKDSLNGCYLGGVGELCRNVARDDAGEITRVDERLTNLSRMTAKGIDFDANYRFEALQGEFSFNLQWTHFLERENQTYNDGTFTFEMEDVTGRFDNDTSYAEDKINFIARYSWEDLNIQYAANYISGLTYEDLLYWGTTPNDPNNPDAGNHQYKVDSVIYHDITANYMFPTQTKLSVGITNFTDELPPYIEPAFNGNTDESTYRLFGRSYFVRLTQKF
ncbi:TonB-dependent receptor domain-containing protein [Ferrimonas balearica]|uniref:TonB-dependent receptor domain-containing protein n=1 Tax=Ferrimonas balearica TaxID=44012 RepID=UPI001C996DA3|nr:TonB-dependent receptor [Ferrimonas balearica]MBY5921157.1 TonB-dependent receptor [Ferrimonas balearica]MBY5996158.1 TonB-dependent receptor [Ferrimonas balearica]